MRTARSPSTATLADILVDGFEKNEVFGGMHERSLPMPTTHAAEAKFRELVAEATRWKGEPLRLETAGNRQLAAWSNLEIRAAGRGLVVRVTAPNFDAWWHDPATWKDDPMADVRAWLFERFARTR